MNTGDAPAEDRTQTRLVPLTSPNGLRWFRDALGFEGCLSLLQHFVTQDNLTFCGPATAAMILNATALSRPESPSHAPFRLFVQEELLSHPSNDVPARAAIAETGMTLHQFASLVAVDGLHVSATYGDQLSIELLRSVVHDALSSEPPCFLVVNYHRPSFGQEGGGHLSPLAAFHPGSDHGLILDVARYRYPPVWVPMPVLLTAMRSIDPGSGRSRGMVKIRQVAR